MLALVAFSATAYAANPEDGTLSTQKEMKSEVFNRIGDLKIQDFKITDCKVEVSYTVDAEGQITVEKVSGSSCVATEYVKNKLESEKMYVSPSLQGTTHSMTLRYVVI